MIDRYHRRVNGIRLSVTNKCNLSCFYCHNEGQDNNNNDRITVKDIEKIMISARDIGFEKVKITGGEPLLTKNIPEIVRVCKQYMKDVSMTTNGVFLSVYTKELINSGLDRINVSIPSLNSRIYTKITGKNNLRKVINGLNEISEYIPVKINMVVLKGINEREISAFVNLCARTGATLQLIELETKKENMDSEIYKKYHTPLNEIENEISDMAGEKYIRKMHHRTVYCVKVNGTFVPIEFVMPMHRVEFCMHCDRIRITSDGKIRTCLFGGKTIDIYEILKKDKKSELIDALKKSVMIREPYWK